MPLGGDGDSIIAAVFVIAILIVSLGVHEAAHAWVANLCGDSTAKDMGRLTLNPLPHIDPVMTILMPGFLFFLSNGTFVFGGAKPVPVVYQRLRRPARDMMLVALAGPLSNVLIALVLFAILKVLVYAGGWTMDLTDGGVVGFIAEVLLPKHGPPTLLIDVLCKSIWFNLLLAVFNMIPLPPLDGSRVVAFLLPEPLRSSFQSLDRFALLLILGLFYSGVLHGPLRGGISSALQGLHVITGSYWI